MAGQLVEQPPEIVELHRHRPSPHPAVRSGCVRKPDEALAGLGLEQLDVGRERARARRPLRHDHLVEELGFPRRCRLLRRHSTTVAAKP